ncbi:MAG: RidA family protein [Thermoflavifilum sp.]|nr:RidA family protein [Thermoflavifilum sp.]
MANRQLISSGTSWEKQFVYSRALRVGPFVFVAGTTAINEAGEVVGTGNSYQQAMYIFQKIEKALQEAGASLQDVVRIRTFVTDISQWEAVGRAQGEIFATIRPVATLVAVKALVHPELMVEIEADAVID